MVSPFRLALLTYLWGGEGAVEESLNAYGGRGPGTHADAKVSGTRPGGLLNQSESAMVID